MKNLLNLYTEELREKPIPYGFPWLVAALVSVALLMLAYGAYTHQKLAAMAEENRILQGRQQALNESIAALEAKIATEEQRAAIEREIGALHHEIQGRERVLAELVGQIERPTEGFSPILRGLASASGHGVWLQNIHLVASATAQPLAEVRLIGRMHQGDRLPHYLDALAQAEPLRGLRFNSLQAFRAEGRRATNGSNAQAGDETITFMLSTRVDDQLQEGEPR
jgi:Tfp pilus assembly protein PilN